MPRAVTRIIPMAPAISEFRLDAGTVAAESFRFGRMAVCSVVCICARAAALAGADVECRIAVAVSSAPGNPVAIAVGSDLDAGPSRRASRHPGNTTSSRRSTLAAFKASFHSYQSRIL